MVHLHGRTIAKFVYIFEPWMLKRIISTYTLIRVNYQQLLYQIDNLLRACVKLLMLKVVVAGRYLIENLISALSLEWEVATHEDVEEHA